MGGVVVISGVGTFVDTGGTPALTTTVVPTAVGNCLVLATDLFSSTITVTGVSGGGVTTWAQIASPQVVTTPFTRTLDIWLGTVTTAGSSTITITVSGSLTGIDTRLITQEFAGGGTGTTWAKDGTQSGGRNNTTSSTTVTFPTLTPGGPNRCYVGYSYVNQTGSTTGQTSGYTLQNDANSNPFIYKPNVSTVQSPTTVQSPADVSTTVGALFTASISPRQLLVQTAVKRSYVY